MGYQFSAVLQGNQNNNEVVQVKQSLRKVWLRGGLGEKEYPLCFGALKTGGPCLGCKEPVVACSDLSKSVYSNRGSVAGWEGAGALQKPQHVCHVASSETLAGALAGRFCCEVTSDV